MNHQSLRLATLRMVMEYGNSLERSNPEEKAERLYQFVIKEDKPQGMHQFIMHDNKPEEAPRKPGRPKKTVGSEESSTNQ